MKTKQEILSIIEKKQAEVALAAWSEFDLKDLKKNYEDLNMVARQLSSQFMRAQNKEGMDTSSNLVRELKNFKQFIIDNYLAGTKIKIY